MKELLKGTPVWDFEVPPGVTLAHINPRTGHEVETETDDSVQLYFKDGTVGPGISEVEVTLDSKSDASDDILSEKDL
jgi:membrane carboxypeptidase/penicillin-binding protein